MNEPTHVQQVGGTHYLSEYQHWDFVIDVDMPYLPACATKYVSRWWKKNGMQDLLKAKSYVEKMISNIHKIKAAGIGDNYRVECYTLFIKSNKIPSLESAFIFELLTWRRVADLERALLILAEIMSAAEAAKQPTGQGQPQVGATPAPMPQSPALPRATGQGQGATGQGAGTNSPTAEQISRSRNLNGLEHPFGYDEVQENG